MEAVKSATEIPLHSIGEAARAVTLERLTDLIRRRVGASVEGIVDHAFGTLIPHLSPTVLNLILALRAPDSSGILLIRGLPVDLDLPATPTDVTPELHEVCPIAHAALLGLVRLLGEPFSYRDEYGGELINHVLPTRTGMTTISSQGSRTLLPYHTEDAHLAPYLPDYIGLMCLRADPRRRARTCLASAKDIRPLLSPKAVEILSLPLFQVNSPTSFGGNTTKSLPIPVLSGPPHQPQIVAEFTDMVSLTGAGEAALDELNIITRQVSKEVELLEGDLLLFDNRRVLHGRTPFEPTMDGTDRWCIRALVKAGDFWDWRLYVHERNVVL